MIPFKINELTQNADPIKLYEYMATGKPIVSTDLHEVKKFSCVKIARDYNEFGKYITDSILNTRDSVEVKKQVDLAKENSWDTRILEIETIISEYEEHVRYLRVSKGKK